MQESLSCNKSSKFDQNVSNFISFIFMYTALTKRIAGFIMTCGFIAAGICLRLKPTTPNGLYTYVAILAQGV
jgi:hypothetical protein